MHMHQVDRVRAQDLHAYSPNRGNMPCLADSYANAAPTPSAPKPAFFRSSSTLPARLLAEPARLAVHTPALTRRVVQLLSQASEGAWYTRPPRSFCLQTSLLNPEKSNDVRIHRFLVGCCGGWQHTRHQCRSVACALTLVYRGPCEPDSC